MNVYRLHRRGLPDTTSHSHHLPSKSSVALLCYVEICLVLNNFQYFLCKNGEKKSSWVRSGNITGFWSRALVIFSKCETLSPHSLSSSDVSLFWRSGSIPFSEYPLLQQMPLPFHHIHYSLLQGGQAPLLHPHRNLLLNHPHFQEDNTDIQESLPCSNMPFLEEKSRK